MASISYNGSLTKFSERLCAEETGPDLGKVGRKFVQSMLLGISRSRSVNLTDISRGLEEKISLHATHKKLSRNLEDPQLAANIGDRLLNLASEQVGPDTPLIIHVYELHKKYARKIEFLSKSIDAPDIGFKVCEILASHPESDSYSPLLAHIWSNQIPGFVSDEDEIRKVVRRVQTATYGNGLLCVDDQSLDFEALRPLMADSGLNFLSLIKLKDPELMYKGEHRTISELLEQTETRYGKILYKLVPEGMVGVSKVDMDLFVHVGATGIKLGSCERPLSFIALKTESSYLGQNLTPILTSKTNLRSRKSLMGLMDTFLAIQDVVGTHRMLRNSFNPENFRVLTFNRLQLLMTLLQAVIHFEVSVQRGVTICDKTFAAKPHDGEFDRTYLLPKAEKAARTGRG